MLNKVLRVNNNHAVVYFTHRSLVHLCSDKDNIDEIIDTIMCPLNSRVSTLSEHIRMMRVSEEDTMVIDIKEVA